MSQMRSAMLVLMAAEALLRVLREDYLTAALMVAMMVFWRAYTTEVPHG